MLKETIAKHAQQLAEEQATRLEIRTKSNDEIQKLKGDLERALKETEELGKRAECGNCVIT